MNAPKITFEYSWIYNQNWKKWIRTYPEFAKEKYPSQKTIKNYINKIRPLWKRYEKKILSEISTVTNLSWKAREIKCYVVGQAMPFSDPLTMPIYEKYPDWFIDVLTHELIHQMFIQNGNEQKAKKAWIYFYKKYAKENRSVRIHIPLHAFHAHIYLKFFGRKRFERELRIMTKYP